MPLAAAVNVAVLPALTLWLVGLVVTTGAARAAGVPTTLTGFVYVPPKPLLVTNKASLPGWSIVRPEKVATPLTPSR